MASDFRTRQTLETSGLHYEFNEHLEMWETLEGFRAQNQDVILTISTHWVTSGYWLELDKGQQTNADDKVYRGNQIDDLRKRVESEITESAELGVSPRFTI